MGGGAFNTDYRGLEFKPLIEQRFLYFHRNTKVTKIDYWRWCVNNRVQDLMTTESLDKFLIEIGFFVFDRTGSEGSVGASDITTYYLVTRSHS